MDFELDAIKAFCLCVYELRRTMLLLKHSYLYTANIIFNASNAQVYMIIRSIPCSSINYVILAISSRVQFILHIPRVTPWLLHTFSLIFNLHVPYYRGTSQQFFSVTTWYFNNNFPTSKRIPSRKMKVLVQVLLLAVVACPSCLGIDVVPKLNVTQYLGRWYQVVYTMKYFRFFAIYHFPINLLIPTPFISAFLIVEYCLHCCLAL